jgi:hypothetical protein
VESATLAVIKERISGAEMKSCILLGSIVGLRRGKGISENCRV